MSRWFRHYAGMMRDDKLVRAAMLSKQTVERVVWIWGAILESAAEINDAGRYDVDEAEVAYFLRADHGDIRAIFDALAQCGRLAEGRVVHWGDRQFDSDRSASRQADYRERKRAARSHGDDTKERSDGRVTASSRHGDAPETETETETETDRSEAKASGAGAPPDERLKLFHGSLETLVRMTGKPTNALRSVLGRWLKQVNDDCRRLNRLIEDAAESNPADPIAFIEGMIKHRGQGPPGDGKVVAPVVFVPVDGPNWRPCSQRWEREKGRAPSALTLRNQGSPGNYFPADWLSAQPERTEA